MVADLIAGGYYPYAASLAARAPRGPLLHRFPVLFSGYLAVGCGSDQDFDDLLAPEAVGWPDPSKASTVGTRFAVAFPNPIGGVGRVLLFRGEHDTNVTLTQHAVQSGWGIESSTELLVRAGLTRVELQPSDWTTPAPSTLIPAEVEVWNDTVAAVMVETDHAMEVVAVWDRFYQDSGAAIVDGDRSAALILPFQELGDTYHVVLPAAADDDAAPEFYYVVVAVEDGTEVLAAPLSEQVSLDAGEAVRVSLPLEEQSSGATWAVTGNHPVAVFTGGGPICTNAFSVVWEQLPPTSRWGREYIAIPIDGHDESELVLATDQSALIEVDCVPAFTLLAGQTVRLRFSQPIRVSGSRPFMALVGSGMQTCVDTHVAPGIGMLTPRVLSRTRMILAPLRLELWSWFEEQGAAVRPLASIDTELSAPVSASPPMAEIKSEVVGSAVVHVVDVAEASTVSGGPFRGIEYGVAPYGEVDEMGYTDHANWRDVAHVTHLGYDCTGCAQLLLSEPGGCPE